MKYIFRKWPSLCTEIQITPYQLHLMSISGLLVTNMILESNLQTSFHFPDLEQILGSSLLNLMGLKSGAKCPVVSNRFPTKIVSVIKSNNISLTNLYKLHITNFYLLAGTSANRPSQPCIWYICYQHNVM